MRKIEKEMCKAAFGGDNWKKDNTEVVVINGVSQVYLHGNHIANVYCGDVEVNVRTLMNWPTSTTKSRLRALGCNVYTSNHVTYLDDQAVNL